MQNTKKSRVGRYKRDLTLAKVRSALTNGSDLLGGDVDHRAAWVRRLRDIIQGHVADAGGVDILSTAQQSIVRRVSMLELQLEMMETRFADNDGVFSADQLLLYQRTANSARRLLEAVGLKRQPRDVTPTSTIISAPSVTVRPRMRRHSRGQTHEGPHHTSGGAV